MGNPKIIFMVYDSRSGSTFLAREIATHLKGCVVTQEISFDRLLQASPDQLAQKGWCWFIDKMYADGSFLNIPLSRDETLSICEQKGSPLGLTEGLKAIIEGIALKNSEIKSPACIIVKNGTHIKYWRHIKKIFGKEAALLFVCRDPRAVVSSKLRTQRVYHPYETMAWAGALVAGWQWSKYSSLAREAEEGHLQVINVVFEEFMSDKSGVLQRIGEILNTSYSKEDIHDAYFVPEKEKNIHLLVATGKTVKTRVDGWKKELSKKDLKAVEAISWQEMGLRGYSPVIQTSSIGRMATKIHRSFFIPFSLARHYYLRITRSVLPISGKSDLLDSSKQEKM